MSGDVQPRKRKDKKRKKDDLGVEEPRGTAAVFGEGDVFMHSQHDHGTGGHWCAKIIFFSLLAVLITLIGLIILENRGLTELEANSVESRYSGVLDGWLEDTPDDDHHDEHTLELKHHHEDEHDDEDLHGDDTESNEIDQEDEDEHDDEDEDKHEDEDEHDDEDEDEHDDEDEDEQELDDEDQDVEENDGGAQEKDENDESVEDNDISREQSDEDDNSADNYENENADEREDDEDELENSLENTHEDEDLIRYKEYYASDKSRSGDKDEYNINDSENKDDDDEDDDDNEGIDYDNAAKKLDLKEDYEENVVEKSNLPNFENENDDDEENGDNTKDENDDELESEQNEFSNEDVDEHDEPEEDPTIEVERIEREVSDDGSEEPALDSDEVTAQAESEKENSESLAEDVSKEANAEDIDDIDDEEVEFLEPDDDDVPIVVEHITAPAGKPLVEVEEETSSEKPIDTLAEEEEYEKQQEELRRKKEEGSNMWLKLVVGGALLVATHAVVRRITAPSDTPAYPERVARAEPSLTDRRMTISEEPAISTAVPRNIPQGQFQQVSEKEVLKSVPIIESAPEPTEENEEVPEDTDVPVIEEKDSIDEKKIIDKELYSDEEEVEEEEEIIEKKIEVPEKATAVQSSPIKKDITPEPDEDPDDVEIIDDEELEEVEDEEEISDVDDAELLNRLEAKYGKLPEPERPGPKQKDGGESLEDDWPGEPSDPYWRRQLEQAEKDFQKGDWSAAAERAGAAELRGSARARRLVALALDRLAEAQRDNGLLSRAISAYLDLLKMSDRLSDKKLLQITARTLDRIQFRGNYLSAEPVYRLLIRRFPDDVTYRNNLTVAFLMANRVDLAEEALKETIKLWPDDRVALAHLGFILKTQHNRLEEAVDAFQKALEGDTGPATEPRFYYHLGDSLLLLGRFEEAHEVHKRGAALGHFLSPAQRSLYNVDRLKGQPWWNVEETPYVKLARALEKAWKEILKEGEAAWSMYEKEKEGLKERGEWSQLDLFVRGREIADRCKRAPVTCAIVKAEPAAVGCRRGQVKFSAMAAGTHVRPHVGPTNCRLRMHLGLSNTKHTYIRVDQQIREWKTGKVLIFDDSFEHEVWHNGTGTRLVLIVDVWHPDLTVKERRQLPAI